MRSYVFPARTTRPAQPRSRRARARIRLAPPNPWRVVAPEVRESWRRDVAGNLSGLNRRLTLDEACGLVRSWYARWEATCPPPIFSDCSRGCSVCCRRYIDVTFAEVIVARDEVLRLARGEREALLARLVATDDATRGMDSATYFAGHHNCPCVGAEGQCLIYAGRPLACRWVHAVSRDDCTRSDGDPKAVQSFDARTSELGSATRDGFCAGLAEYGYDASIVALPAALHMVFDGPGLLEGWCSGDPVPDGMKAVY